MLLFLCFWKLLSEQLIFSTILIWILYKIYRVGRENLYTFEIAAISAVSTLQRHVIRGWNGNFVGFSGLFSKILKNVPMNLYLHFSGKRQNRPTRIWNLTLKFDAIWGHYGLKPLISAYFNSNIWIVWYFFTSNLKIPSKLTYLPFLPLARNMQIQLHRNIFQNFWKKSRKAHKISVPSSYYTFL